MPTEQLILRRVFPVPVTFADMRRAYTQECTTHHIYPFGFGVPSLACGAHLTPAIRTWWHAAIKDATGALDEVYAVIDGREVRVATIAREGATDLITENFRAARGEEMFALLIKADEAGYWQRPHEVRHALEEPQMSHATMQRIAANSIAAGSK